MFGIQILFVDLYTDNQYNNMKQVDSKIFNERENAQVRAEINSNRLYIDRNCFRKTAVEKQELKEVKKEYKKMYGPGLNQRRSL